MHLCKIYFAILTRYHFHRITSFAYSLHIRTCTQYQSWRQRQHEDVYPEGRQWVQGEDFGGVGTRHSMQRDKRLFKPCFGRVNGCEGFALTKAI